MADKNHLKIGLKIFYDNKWLYVSGFQYDGDVPTRENVKVNLLELDEILPNKICPKCKFFDKIKGKTNVKEDVKDYPVLFCSLGQFIMTDNPFELKEECSCFNLNVSGYKPSPVKLNWLTKKRGVNAYVTYNGKWEILPEDAIRVLLADLQNANIPGLEKILV